MNICLPLQLPSKEACELQFSASAFLRARRYYGAPDGGFVGTANGAETDGSATVSASTVARKHAYRLYIELTIQMNRCVPLPGARSGAWSLNIQQLPVMSDSYARCETGPELQQAVAAPLRSHPATWCAVHSAQPFM